MEFRIPNFVPFELERWQSLYETTVEYNLADSGVRAVSLGELVGEGKAVERMLETPLGYPPVGGTRRLRELVAELHLGADTGNVLVTVGAAEANAIAAQTLLEPGARVVTIEPSYRQLWGTARNIGCEVDTFSLREEDGWRLDVDELKRKVRPSTKLICLTNPNNPVGTILTENEIGEIVELADQLGAWILADEVYRGAERTTDAETPTLFGRYERVVCVGSVSKAYGLPGLRTGWLVGPSDLVERAWRRHEYATISTGVLSMMLAEVALAESTRQRLLTRSRRLIREGYSCIERWIEENEGLLSVVPPAATALAFVRYDLGVPSLRVAHAIRKQASVLVCAGEHFGVERHLRINHSVDPAGLRIALSRVRDVLESLRGAKQEEGLGALEIGPQ